jgi:outer membrane lipoprotein-sorting protein
MFRGLRPFPAAILPLRHAGSRLWVLIFSVFIFASPGFAQRRSEQRPPLDPAQAEREARALVADMLAQKPAQTNTGRLKIRDANGMERELPMRFEIWSNPTSSTSVYQATDPKSHQETKLTVVHVDGQPNQYQLREGSAPERKLAGDQTMIPFAGSDFWVADLGLEFLHWPQQRLKTKEMRRSRFCEVLESVNPKPSGQGYSRVVSWIEQERPHGIVHADAYDAQGDLIKRFDPTEFQKIQGEYQLAEMEIRSRRTGSRSWIEFDLNGP